MANPLLALSVQPANIDVAGSLARGQEMQTAKLGNMLAQYQLRKAQAADERTNALALFNKEHGAGLVAGNDADVNALAAIDPEAALGIRDKLLGQKKTQGEIRFDNLKLNGEQIKQGIERAEFIGRSAESILSAPEAARPLLYQRALQQAKDLGIEIEGAPQQYSDQAVAGMRAQALSVKDQLDAKMRQAALDETKRSNLADESNTRRGQNMTDARAREAAEKAGQSGGRSIQERMQNTVLEGDPSTPQYAAAYAWLSKPRTTIDTQTGQAVTIKQDLSWARPPVGGKPSGQPTVSVGNRVLPPKQTQEQKLAAGFAERMAQAEQELTAVESATGNPSDVAKDNIPLIGNYLVSEEFQKADQARRNWINAQLRRESGATIQPPEFENANRQYFVMPGDSKAVIEQKRRNRKTAEAAMKSSGAVPTAATSDGSKVIDFNDLPDN